MVWSGYDMMYYKDCASTICKCVLSILDQNHTDEDQVRSCLVVLVQYYLWNFEVYCKVWCNIPITWYQSVSSLTTRRNQGVCKILSPTRCIYSSSNGSKTCLTRLEHGYAFTHHRAVWDASNVPYKFCARFQLWRCWKSAQTSPSSYEYGHPLLDQNHNWWGSIKFLHCYTGLSVMR